MRRRIAKLLHNWAERLDPEIDWDEDDIPWAIIVANPGIGAGTRINIPRFGAVTTKDILDNR